MKEEIRLKVQSVSILLLVCYLMCLTEVLFFAENLGRVGIERAYTYNLELFKEIKRFWNYREELGSLAMFMNIAGNIICFLPFGFLLPAISRKMKNIWVITFLSLDVSLLVETVQFISRVGSFDVDDILLNTAGGVLGFFIFSVCNVIRRNNNG